MEVTNCRDCGGLFNYISGPRRCPECQKKLEAERSLRTEKENDRMRFLK